MQVAVPVGRAFDDSGHAVRGRLGDYGRPFLEDVIDPGHPVSDQKAPGDRIKGHGQGNGKQTPEKIAVNRALGQSPEGVCVRKCTDRWPGP